MENKYKVINDYLSSLTLATKNSQMNHLNNKLFDRNINILEIVIEHAPDELNKENNNIKLNIKLND